MSTEIKEERDSIPIIPDWEQMVRYFGYTFAQQGWKKNSYKPVASFIEMVAHLTQTNPEAVKRLIEEFSTRANTNKE